MVPLGTMIVNWELADVWLEFRTRLVELRFVVSPDGKEKAERLTVPVKPPEPLTMIVELPDEPGLRIRKGGFVVRLKAAPVTWTWMNVFRVIVPLVAEMRMG